MKHISQRTLDHLNVAITAEKFERENGKRHRKLRGMRDANLISTPLFSKMYDAEEAWLNKNGIKYSPSLRAWFTQLGDHPAAQYIAAEVAKRTDIAVTANDYITWFAGDGKGDNAKFQRAFVKLVGKRAALEAERVARVPDLLSYTLGIGYVDAAGVNMKRLANKAEPTAATNAPDAARNT